MTVYIKSLWTPSIFLQGMPFIFLLPLAIRPPLIPTPVSLPVAHTFRLSNVSWSLGFEVAAELV